MSPPASAVSLPSVSPSTPRLWQRRRADSPRLSQLSNAYAALAAELTKKEIRSIGGYSLGRVIGEGALAKPCVFVRASSLTGDL